MRKFEVISREQFLKDVPNGIYDDILLPTKKTKYSAGYDFIAVDDITLFPGEVKKIPTGIKVAVNDDEYLAVYVRSSLGIKYNIRMCNQTGIVDKDYYNNQDNEGHIWICLQNQGQEEYVIKKGTGFAQGVFMKYLLTDDDECHDVRMGGIGSTDGRNNNE